MAPQEISAAAESTTVVYTYSVEYREDKEVVWGTRWDRFLVNSDPNIHWYSIINSLIILLFLSGMVAVIMLRTLYNDISVYNDEESKVRTVGGARQDVGGAVQDVGGARQDVGGAGQDVGGAGRGLAIGAARR